MWTVSSFFFHSQRDWGICLESYKNVLILICIFVKSRQCICLQRNSLIDWRFWSYNEYSTLDREKLFQWQGKLQVNFWRGQALEFLREWIWFDSCFFLKAHSLYHTFVCFVGMLLPKCSFLVKDENISNYEYICTSIL